MAAGLPRGLVPKGVDYLTVGIDIGKWICHYVVIAWLGDGGSHIADYGIFEVESDRIDTVDRATLIALREFRDVCDTGWPSEEGGAPKTPDAVWIDSGYHESQAAVYGFCRESSPSRQQATYRPTRGFGASQSRDRRYTSPTKKTTQVRFIGDGFHISRIQKDKIDLVHVNADHWKSRTHQRLSIPQDAPGAQTIFLAPPNEHNKFAKHITSERQVEEFKPGQPPVIVWVRHGRQPNHWLDALALGNAAASFCGVRSMAKVDPQREAEAKEQPADWFSSRTRTRRSSR